MDHDVEKQELAAHAERKRHHNFQHLPKTIQQQVQGRLRDVGDPLSEASWIFSEFKDRYSGNPLIELVTEATGPNESLWHEAGRLTTEAVWKLILRDHIIGQQDRWIEMLRRGRDGNLSNQIPLSKLEKLMDSFRRRVALLKDSSPVPGIQPCEIHILIDYDYTRITGLLRTFAFQQLDGDLVDHEVVQQIEPILKETVIELKRILSRFSRLNFINATDTELGQSSLLSYTGRSSSIGDSTNLSDTNTTDALHGSWSSVEHLEDDKPHSLAPSLAMLLGKGSVDTVDPINRIRTPETDWGSNASGLSRSPSISSKSSKSSRSSLSSADTANTEYSWREIDAVCDRIKNNL